MIIHIYYVYAIVRAGEAPVGVVVGITLPITIIAAGSASLVVLLAVIVLMQKVKQRGTVDIEPTVSVGKYSMQILLHCTLFLSCLALVYFNSQDLIAVLNWYNFVEKMDDWLSYSQKLAEVY